MNVAFVNPSVGFAPGRRRSIPVGLAYIMAFLRAHGHLSEGFDFGDSLTEPGALVDIYGLHTYPLVGFSVYNESFLPTMEMTDRIKQLSPRTFTVLGGPQATATHDTILAHYPSIDGVIRREGEFPMLALLEALASGCSLDTVPNLTWRRPDGHVQANPEVPALEDLDGLPFPDATFTTEHPYPPLGFYDVGTSQLHPAIMINTSRSCPYNCSFCGVLTIGRRYRSRSAMSVVDELRYFRTAHERDYRHIYFSDANFFVQYGRALEIVKELHSFDPRITFSFSTRVNQLLHARDTLEEMTLLGLRFVEIGVESASPTVLARLAKGVAPSVNIAAVRMLRRLNIEIALDFIMVDPASTLQDIELNLDFLEENGFLDYYPHEHLYTSLGLYEGTPIRAYFEERFNRKFLLGQLPRTEDIIEDPDVLQFWNLTQSFKETYQRDVDRVLAETESVLSQPWVKRILGSPRDDRYALAAHLQLDAVSLRHAPTMFFRWTLEAIQNGRDVDADGAGALKLGTPGVSLGTLLARVQKSARQLLDHLPDGAAPRADLAATPAPGRTVLSFPR
jgi:radical SAM superfamily enzyme YgiQ (UPF0313 family)